MFGNAEGSDIRTDIPEYKIFKNGKFVEYVNDISSIWRSDFVVFLFHRNTLFCNV